MNIVSDLILLFIKAMTAHTEIVKGITTVTGTIETTNEIITNEINYEVNG